MIPVYDVHFTEEDVTAVSNAVRSNILSSFGSDVQKLEKQFAGYVGTKYALSCTSGTTGLYLALFPFIKPGDAVAVPTCSFAATAFAVSHLRGKVIFIDADQKTWNMNLDLLEEACKQHKIKVVLAVPNYGNPLDYDRLKSLSNMYGFTIVEDACEALSSTYKGKMVGSIGETSVFSFYGNKLLSVTGDTPIYIRKNNNIAVIQASDLDNMTVDNLECASFSPIDGTIKWAPVNKIISHDYQGNIIRIKLEYNKHIDVTTNHNLFILREGKIVDVPTDKLKYGDYVVCPKLIPDNEQQRTIDLLDVVSHKNLWRCGRGARNKYIPTFIFNSNYESKVEFLRGYWNGDGCKRNTSVLKSKNKTYVEFKTSSKLLATQLQYLLLTIGCVSAIEYDKARNSVIMGRMTRSRKSYKIRISDNKFINIISMSKLTNNYVGPKSDMVPVSQFNYKSNHERVNQSRITNVSFLNKDLCFLQIKSIRKIKSGTNRVYDLSVPSRYENFVAGYGGICLHNSSGEGGIVTTNDQQHYELMKLERGQGQDPNKRFHHLTDGWNFRLTNLQAAVINSQFARINDISNCKKLIYEYYRDHLNSDLIWQEVPDGGEHCWWMVSVRHWDHGWYNRAQAYLSSNGIETRPIFPPIHMMPAANKFEHADVMMPNSISEMLTDTGITLPSGPTLTLAQLDYICKTVNKIV